MTLGDWHTIHVTRSGRTGQLTVDGQVGESGSSPGPFTQLTLLQDLYLGGCADWREIWRTAGVNRSLHGCIQKVRTTLT